MKHTTSFRVVSVVLVGLAMVLPTHANNLSVGAPTLTGQDTENNYTFVQFDLSWDNSWRDNTTLSNWDAAWVFVKYKVTGGDWAHATLNTSGHSVTTENSVSSTITAASDGMGVFIHRSSESIGSNNWDGIKLRWNYGTDDVADAATVTVKVFAIEMVYIPGGASFWVGNANNSSYSGFITSDGSYSPNENLGPYQITTEGAINVGEGLGNLDYDFDNAGGDRSGPIPADFPKGYSSFYMMKYEGSQGQYADFLNTLTSTQDGNRSIQGEGSYTTKRGTISGSQGSRSASKPDRACNFISWMDGAAYTDWAGLRPMTEFEFEKACRGTQSVVDEEYPWGSTFLIGAATIIGSEDGTETISASNANCHYGNAALSGGDGGVGPIRGGIFATGSSSRVQAGAGYYGVMELAGNAWERPVTVGNSNGRAFSGTHGDGTLSTAGYATNSDWPGYDGDDVTGATGSGFRGGSIIQTLVIKLRTSDRFSATTNDASRVSDYSFRCVRTAP